MGDIPHGDYSPHTAPTAISTWEIYRMATIALTPHPQLYQHGRYTAWRTIALTPHPQLYQHGRYTTWRL